MNEPIQTVAEVLGITHGEAYTWEQNGMVFTWCIDMARRIIGDRPVDLHMPMAAQKLALQYNLSSNELNVDYAMKTDLKKPLIAVVSPIETDPEHVVILIIDGWHRIKKSVLTDNQEPLPVHVLSPEEEAQCRIVKIK